MDRDVGKVVDPDRYAESNGMKTHDRIVTRSHISCLIPDRYVVSPVASRILVVGSGSEALQRPGALQEYCRGRIRSIIQRPGALQERCRYRDRCPGQDL